MNKLAAAERRVSGSTPTASIPTTSSFRADIQGLRAIAVLSVVFYHTDTAFAGGFVGVDVFFVISGFVIAGVLLRELESTGSIDLRRFYSRRVRRLIPALGVMLLGVGVISALVLSPLFPQPVAFRTGAWAAASGANIYLWLFGGGYFGPADESNPLVHTWSLGIEEQFYLVFPMLVLLAWMSGTRTGRQPRRQLSNVLIAVVVLSFVASLIFTYDLFGFHERAPGGERFAFYGTIGRAWEFGVGVLLAIVMGRRRSLGPAALGWIGALALVGTFFLLDQSIAFPGLVVVVPVVGTVLLLLNGSGSLRAILENPVLVWIGDRSYGWYLWHWPFIVFAKTLLPDLPFGPLAAALLALVPTVLSYRFVESRFRAPSGAPTGGAVRVSLLFALVPLGLLTTAALLPQSAWGLDSHPERETASASNAALCFEFRALTENCSFEPPGSTQGTILLVGDSHAGAISAAVLDAAAARNYRVVVHTVSSCPFVLDEERFARQCFNHNQGLVDIAADLQPDVLIVANRSNGYTARFDLGVQDIGVDANVLPSDQALEDWSRGLSEALGAASPHVNRVVLFSIVPQFDAATYDRSLPSVLWPNGLSSSLDREEVEGLRMPVLEVEAQVLAQLANPTTIIDPIDAYCDDAECRFKDDDGRFLYRDPSHLTPFGADRLFDDFATAITG